MKSFEISQYFVNKTILILKEFILYVIVILRTFESIPTWKIMSKK